MEYIKRILKIIEDIEKDYSRSISFLRFITKSKEIFNKERFLAQLPYLKQAILDEGLDKFSFPALGMISEYEEGIISPIKDNGYSPRVDIMHSVGYLCCKECIPELREVILHDNSEFMREVSVESLMDMIFNSKRSNGIISEIEKVADALIDRLIYSKNRRLREDCANVLGYIKNENAVVPLENICEEETSKITIIPATIEKNWDNLLEKVSHSYLLGHCLDALAYIGTKRAKNIIEYYYNSDDIVVGYEARKALQTLLMDSNTKIISEIQKNIYKKNPISNIQKLEEESKYLVRLQKMHKLCGSFRFIYVPHLMVETNQ